MLSLVPTVGAVDVNTERSVVLLNPQYWGERAPQLASLLKMGVQGPIGDPSGRHADSTATVAHPEYWSRNVNELADALLEEGRRKAPVPTAVAVGATSSSAERLTMSVEEVARALGISRAFAYEAVHRGDIPHIKIGRRMLVPRAALARVLVAAEQPDET